ncbi:aspartate aminotransferase, cytoplasmic-like [Carcharodon carcharias]|uniref:aspartate aminotransferase, cytoplasmic-like n=1 Tax=Carcharodon carcharias TaxID=13397 RepID=UPI001B7F0CCF|nr:aspartate aminotransferase, cytoplasmic-like [Carcharodon carcharias]
MALLLAEYCADNGQPWVLPVVKKVQQQIVHDPTLSHEYLSVRGLPEFNRATTALILGADSIAIVEKRADSIQVPGGCGSLCMGARFLKKWYTITHPKAVAIYISSPSWETHMTVFQEAGFMDIFKYRYWDNENLCVAIHKWLEDLQNAPEYSIVVLHIAAHWPTAMDPTPAEWKQIAEVMKRKKQFPFFYVTAQGLASGDLNKDAWPVRHFVTERFELFCAQSFGKNFGLYNDRVGSLTVVSRDNYTLIRIRSQMELAARQTWSNPPRYGARIVATILNNPAFFAEWRENLKRMAERLMLLKEKLKEELRTLGTLRSWEHITRQIGLFIYPGFTDFQIDYLMKKKHIYLSSIAQINISLINSQNLTYIAQCINEAVLSNPEDMKL